ncbi:MAG: elongation factor G [Spirochaetales bacterium]|jgi:elongation factor G|nr:elongation factor G [Spirochaetales bacterium]
MAFATDTIRNVALAGHLSTGKTALMENLLAAGGVIPRAEAAGSGKTVSDYTPEEKEKGISIHLTAANLEWQGKKINILDAPGASDFVGEVVAAFRCAETGILLVASDSGIQIETIKLWRRLDARQRPRIIFINKMQKDRADFEKILQDLSAQFKETFVPLAFPDGAGGSYKGIVDIIGSRYYAPGSEGGETPGDIPEPLRERALKLRSELMEAAAEGDDGLLEKYFEEGSLSEEELLKGLALAFAQNKFVPVFCGNGETGSGLSCLLNFIASSCPSPLGAVEKIKNPEGQELDFKIDPASPPCLLAIKTTIDQFSGKLSLFKAMGGTIAADQELFNMATDKKERIGKIYVCEGKKLTEVHELAAGDIGVLAKIETLPTSGTLTSPENKMAFVPLRLPQPVHAVAISAVNKKEEDKLNQALHKAAEEDLTFQIQFNKETRETVVSSMGELHLNMILDKIKEKQKIEIEVRVPRVAYRETITKGAEAEYTHKKQSGGHGQYGKVLMQISPLPRGEHMTFENAIKGGSISKGYMPGIEKGIVEGMEEGYLAGYPIVDLAARIIDGKEHPVDSSEMAFKLAGKGALKAALEKAGVTLLEPVMRLSVFSDEQYVGDILSDLSSRRGRVLGQEPVGGGIVEIDALVPQAEMLRYSIDLRSITSGTASFELEFDHYDPISGKIADGVIAASKAAGANP